MKKRYTLLGLVIGTIAFAFCSLSVSAKEKPDYGVGDESLSIVPCETFDIMLTAGDDLVYRHAENNNVAVMPYIPMPKEVSKYADPYLKRSQAWIRWNNINAIGQSATAKNAAQLEGLTVRLC